MQGILFSTALAIISTWIGHYIPMLSSILIALLLGIVINQFVKLPVSFLPGIRTSGGKLLELSILFLALGINAQYIVQLGWDRLFVLMMAVISLLLITVFLANKFRCPGTTGWLVGFGTAICGSSAIAALAPTLSGNKEDTGMAIAVVNLYGLLGMIVLPLLLMHTNLPLATIALIIGGSLHSVGNVAGAGFAINPAVGTLAVSVKLARVALLSPALIFFNILVRRQRISWKEHVRLPWYLWGFLGISTIASFVPIPVEIVSWADEIGKFMVVVAMAAIGLTIEIKTLWQTGKKGLLFGGIIFIIFLTMVVFFHEFIKYVAK